MGWYGDSGTRRQKIDDLTKAWRDDVQCLRHCYRGNAYRGVLWSVWEDPAGRSIHCDLLEYRSGLWWNKPMCESMGPFYYSCPLGYLELVPVADEQWRECVRSYHAKRRKKREVVNA